MMENELHNIEDYFYSFLNKSNYNYSKETLNLMIQIKTLSPRKFPELKWNWTINTQGRRGYNGPSDLHMEHLNQRMKTMIATWCYTWYMHEFQRTIWSRLTIVSHKAKWSRTHDYSELLTQRYSSNRTLAKTSY